MTDPVMDWVWADLDSTLVVAKFDASGKKLLTPHLFNLDLLAVISKHKNWGIVTHRCTLKIEEFIKEKSKWLYPFYKKSFKGKTISINEDHFIEIFEIPIPELSTSIAIIFHILENGMVYILENLLTCKVKALVEQLTKTTCSFVCTADIAAMCFVGSRNVPDLFDKSFQNLANFECNLFTGEKLTMAGGEFDELTNNKNIQFNLSHMLITNSVVAKRVSKMNIYIYDDVFGVLDAMKKVPFNFSKRPEIEFHANWVNQEDGSYKICYLFSRNKHGWLKNPDLSLPKKAEEKSVDRAYFELVPLTAPVEKASPTSADSPKRITHRPAFSSPM